MKWLSAILAAISVLFNNDAPKVETPAVLNSAIIAYTDTYYVPTVADPGNFPRAKTIKLTVSVPAPVQQPTPPPPTPPISPPPAPPPPPSPPPAGDPYLALVEPVTSWLRMNFTLAGDGFETPQPREFGEIKIDREYWKIEVFSYWAVGVTPLKPPVENDYFKLEVYEKGTNKLIYTMRSGKEDSFHKFQVFKKSGEYYFKTYTKPIMTYEINLFVSPKIAQ
ncbi:hypothetical protein A2567_00905 [Candidatus Azambacteria bacterium RIFOXYD1_FULL_42_11]|uniref:Uncharacterized protein n=3 Tax=Candidatus Azamiibacteriota TaxID=1752741 RepID=A0A0G1BK32_9BACT|nr:MAG: hypothetical protein UV10_C0001G0083 [Candidatus Azambacteria bacterium GW2011_GWA1_42_19]KKS75821.1 MAG: hypothetical protein UV48_C0006G0035 [Candidatus Azambacteria bacterium GW2011_GWA2_42_9]KKS88932.1 MAG: hypothetical protein UV62_C0001G0074 [Parcubacteria group bacterium GW2011_GWC1_43_11]OGD41781.1 MAG: hypothetical protein A2567_00905 [Candidatus Azambacteria bacterium RIFOXYD1_FULL_42_11]